MPLSSVSHVRNKQPTTTSHARSRQPTATSHARSRQPTAPSHAGGKLLMIEKRLGKEVEKESETPW